METAFIIIALLGLIAASVLWGADSRDDPAGDRRRWFIELDGRRSSRR